MAFGKFRHSNIKGEKGSDWYIEIWKDGFSGSSTEFDMQGEGFEVTWNGQGSTRNRTFMGSQCDINFYVQNSADESFIYDTLTSGFQSYFIRIYRGVVNSGHTNLWWYGWVQPSFDVIENTPFPYVYSLVSTDSYGYYNKQASGLFANEADKNNSSTVLSELISAFSGHAGAGNMKVFLSSNTVQTPAPSNLYWFRTNCDWWQNGDYNASLNPLEIYRFSAGAVAEKTKIDTKTGEVLEGNQLAFKRQDAFNNILQTFNLVGFLAEGKYNFIQPNSYYDSDGDVQEFGTIKTFNYSGPLDNAQGPTNLATDLVIDQTNNVILGGSTITYDPPLKSATINFNQAESSFSVTNGTNIEGTAITAGFSKQNSGVHTLKFITHNTRKVLSSAFNISSGFFIHNHTFTTTCELTIKLTNNTDTYYLQSDAGLDYRLTWVQSNNTPLTLDVQRGYNISGFSSNPVNDISEGNCSPVSNSNTSGFFPCKATEITNVSNNFYEFRTVLKFEVQIDSPPITGDISIKTNTSINFFQTNGLSNSSNIIALVNPSSFILNQTEVVGPDSETDGITYTPTEQNDSSLAGSNVVFKSSQSSTIAFESEDLGVTSIGQTNVNRLYSVQATESGIIVPVQNGFQRGSATNNPKNIIQLYLNEYLALQTKPLEILQADIQSSTISPLKMIKYSINNDSNKKYYQFLGGTFKAQSEIMSGEWYSLGLTTPGVTSEPSLPSAEFISNSYNPINTVFANITKINNSFQDNFNLNVLGVLDTALTSGTGTTQISLVANVKGKYYSGQKLYLTTQDGSNQLEITCSATKTGVDHIDVNSIAPNRDFPVGSLILVNTADLTNVSFGEGDSLIANNIGTIYNTQICLTATDFVSTNSSTSPGNVDATGAFITAPTSSTLLIANFQIPLGYKGVSVIVYGNDTSSTFTVRKSQVDNRATTEVGSSIAINSTRTLSSGQNGVAGVYWSIIVNLGATNRLITGAKIIIATI